MVSGQWSVVSGQWSVVSAGQGTTAKELIEEVGQLDMLLVCCGGGGLLSGCAIATKYLNYSQKLGGQWSVEPAPSFPSQVIEVKNTTDH